MVAFRDSEISLANIPENASNLWRLLMTQSDGLPWNGIDGYGIFYLTTLPFFFVGLVIAVGVLIHAVVNRINLLFLPMIFLSAKGLYYTFRYLHPRATLIPFGIYFLFFASFSYSYFSSYERRIEGCFCRGLKSAVSFIETDFPAAERIRVAPSCGYSRILFLTAEDLLVLQSPLRRNFVLSRRSVNRMKDRCASRTGKM